MSITIEEALGDVSTRFLANLPEGEATVDRVFFQIQQAHWYYEDFYADEGMLPHMHGETFAKALFEQCPLLQQYVGRHAEFRAQFQEYMKAIPVFGTILLNPSRTHIVLVRGWKGNTWTFPRGKLNQGEDGVACAARETREEIGFDPAALLDPNAYVMGKENGRSIRLYVVFGVPDTTVFNTATRKEISEIAWFELASIAHQPKSATVGKYRSADGSIKTVAQSRLFGVHTFIAKLRPLLALRKGRSKKGKAGGAPVPGMPAPIMPATAPSTPAKKAVGKVGRGGSGSAANSNSGAEFGVVDHKNSETFGSDGSWSVDAMFAANEALLGRQYTYDGNPHTFGMNVAPVPNKRSQSASAAPVPRRPATASGSSGGGGGGEGKRDRGKPKRGELMEAAKEAIQIQETFGHGSGDSWSTAQMFEANERLLGRKFTYDGNPHQFGMYTSSTYRPLPARVDSTIVAAPAPDPTAPQPKPCGIFGPFMFDRQAITAALRRHIPAASRNRSGSDFASTADNPSAIVASA